MNLDKIVAKNNYVIRYDLTNFCKITSAGLLFPNFKLILRRVACSNPNPRKKEFVFFRILENLTNEKCIQFIIFYQWQYLPPHKHDYHPFFIFLNNKSQVRCIIYDKGHHNGKIVYPTKDPLVLSVFKPDHGYTTQFKSYYVSKPFKCTYKAFKPKQIIYFWKINSMAQLKLRTKLIDPWTPGIKYTFRDEVKCPYCKSKHLFDFMNVEKNRLVLEVKCKDHKFMAEYNIKSQIFSAKKI
ncbi:MAG: hypothetical protein ACTSRG_12815 [Candidatus Helarchaeota archaeon]